MAHRPITVTGAVVLVAIFSSCARDTQMSLYDIAAWGRGADAADRAIRRGDDINGVHPQTGWTPLHIAARNGHERIVSYLVAAGADVNVRDKDGNTPLHFAALGGHQKCVNALVGGGADTNVQNDAGETPRLNLQVHRDMQL